MRALVSSIALPLAAMSGYWLGKNNSLAVGLIIAAYVADVTVYILWTSDVAMTALDWLLVAGACVPILAWLLVMG